MADTPQTFEVTVTQPTDRVQELLQLKTGLPGAQIKRAMTCGAVWLASAKGRNRIRRNSVKLATGDEITLNYHPEVLREAPLPVELMLDHKDFSIWFKPAGMPVSGSRYGDHTALKRCIEMHHKPGTTIYLVHRLDRFTAGLILVAHNKQSAARLSSLFETRQIAKRYHALVKGKLPEALTIDQPLDGKSATSHITPVQSDSQHTLVSVAIDSGRKHQIRRHLALLGHPILGDRQYGEDSSQDLQLVASGLAFELEGEAVNLALDEAYWPKSS